MLHRLKKVLPWMVLAILGIGVLIHAFQTIKYRTEEHLAMKAACLQGTQPVSVDCTIYLGPRWTGEPMADHKTPLSEAP